MSRSIAWNIEAASRFFLLAAFSVLRTGQKLTK